MECVVCKKEKNENCLCGYCQDCIEIYGHQGCKEIMEDRKSKGLEK